MNGEKLTKTKPQFHSVENLDYTLSLNKRKRLTAYSACLALHIGVQFVLRACGLTTLTSEEDGCQCGDSDQVSGEQ